MKKLYLCLLVSISALYGMAQNVDTANVPVWIEMMQDPDANFFETQRAFELYWEGRPRQKGDGWKPFKRWEYHRALLINPDGAMPPQDNIRNEYTQARIAFNQNQQGTESINGDWVEIGPIAKPDNGTGQPNGNGRLNTICFHPTNANTFWVGAPSGGLWKTTDGGQTWTSNTDQLPSLGVSAMVVDQSNTNTLYIGTGDRDAGDAAGLGVYKSTDGGQSWTVSNSGMGNRTVGAMLIHPTNTSILLAATSNGIYRSTNAGSSWSLTTNTSGLYFKDLKYKPGDPNTVYATKTTSNASFYKSTDGGQTWTPVTSGLGSGQQRYVIGVSAANANVVYVLASVNSAYGGLYKSTDSGNSFTLQSSTPNLLGYAEDGSGTGGQGWYDLAMAVAPNNANTVYAGGVNIWKSTDSGVTWDCVAHWVGSGTAAAVHADQHWFAYSPVNGNLYACNDGGLHRTSDGGQTWPELSSGLAIGQVYKIGVSQQTNALVINGYQDNGTALWDNTLFRTEIGGDGMECLIDPTDDNVIYGSLYYGDIRRSLNNGVNFSQIAANGTNGITESGAWVTPYTLSKTNTNVMFVGYKNIWRSTNVKSENVSFTQISSLGTSYNMRQLRQSKTNSSRLFAIREDNKLYKSDNVLAATPTWTDLSSTLPGSGTLRDVETSPTDNNTLWIVRNNDIYKSTNAGASWTDISGTLPGIPMLTICADPLSDGGLYVGTTAGVYYIDNSLADWIPFDDNLPANVSVEELEIYHPQGNWTASRIRAGTYGRGLWESDLYDPGNIAPMAFIGLSATTSDVCQPETITLYNNSAYGATSSLWTITPATGVTFVGGTNSSSTNPQIKIANAGTYSVKLVVSNAYGADSLTLSNAITISSGLPFPWYEDFEGNPICASGGCQTTCEVVDWKNVKNGSGDDIDWRPDNYGTPWSVANYSSGGNTGPSVDFDPGTSAGTYMFISSYPPYTACYNQVGYLESPCLSLHDLTVPKIKFAYHMFGVSASMNDLDLEIYSNNAWTNLWTQAGTNLGDQWQVDSVSLNSYVNQNVKLRFVGNSGSGWQADMAIDGIYFTAGPKAKFTANDSTPCKDQLVVFTNQSTQSPTSWLWTITPNTYTYMGGTSATSQHPQVKFTANGNYNIQLKATNAYGNHTLLKSAWIKVSSPVFSIEPSKPNAEFCPEDSVLLYVPHHGTQYKFYRNGTLTQFGSDSTTYYPTWNTGDYVTVELTDSNGCVGKSDTLFLTKLPPAEGTLASSDDDNIICEGDEVTFTASGNALANYDFLLNGSSAQSSADSTWTTNALANGNDVKVALLNIYGCNGQTESITTEVLPTPPTPSITTMLDSLHCTIVADIHMWEVDSVIQEETGATLAKQGDGTYRVRISQNGCWSLWSEPLIITGFNGNSGTQVKVWPSPTRDLIHIGLGAPAKAATASLRLFDANGKVVKTETIYTTSTATVDLGSLSAGVYTLILNLDGKNFALPIVKE